MATRKGAGTRAQQAQASPTKAATAKAQTPVQQAQAQAKQAKPVLSPEERLAARPVYRMALVAQAGGEQTTLVTYSHEYRHTANVREAGAHMLEGMLLARGVRLVVLDGAGQVVADVPSLAEFRGGTKAPDARPQVAAA